MNGIPNKAESNLRKHGVSFQEAATVFGDDLGMTVYDPDHSKEEDRYITIGWSNRRRFNGSYTDRENRIRIISARELTSREQKDYEKEIR